MFLWNGTSRTWVRSAFLVLSLPLGTSFARHLPSGSGLLLPLKFEETLIHSFHAQTSLDLHTCVFLPSPREVAFRAMVTPLYKLCHVFSDAPSQTIYYHCHLAPQTDNSSTGILRHSLPDHTVMLSHVASYHLVQQTRDGTSACLRSKSPDKAETNMGRVRRDQSILL